MFNKEKIQAELDFEKSLEQFVGKRVEVEYSQSQDWASSKGTMRGWIFKKDDKKFYLIKTMRSHRGFYLTGGLFDGFSATLTVKGIKAV